MKQHSTATKRWRGKTPWILFRYLMPMSFTAFYKSTEGTNETCQEFLPKGKSALWGSLRRESTGKTDTRLWFPLHLTPSQRNGGQMEKWRNLWARSETAEWEAELINHPGLFMPLSLLEPCPPGICSWNKLLRILILSQIEVVPAVPTLGHSCKWDR